MDKAPKIIHALWLDFRNRADGKIPDYLNTFVKRIRELHQGWEIKLWTNWKEIEEDLRGTDREFMIQYINNPFCNGANKSDCLRFHILEKYGGVWIDLSTYLIEPLDSLYDKYSHSFTTIYMPSHDMFMWVIKQFSDNYEEIISQHKVQYAYRILDNILYSKYKFVCESYFIMSPAHHPILKDTLRLMSYIWNKEKLDEIVSAETHCDYLNKVMRTLIPQIYVVKKDIMKIFDFDISIYDCGYLWIYLLMTITTNNYIKNNKLTLHIDKLTDEQESLLNKSKSTQYICHTDFCQDLNYKKNGNTEVHLISSSWWRFIKWSDNRENRLSWKETYVGNLINHAFDSQMSKEEFLDILLRNNITQLKTGAYTREPTAPMIEKLNHILNPTISHENAVIKVKKITTNSNRFLALGFLKNLTKLTPSEKQHKRKQLLHYSNFFNGLNNNEDDNFVNSLGPRQLHRASQTRRLKARASQTRKLKTSKASPKASPKSSPKSGPKSGPSPRQSPARLSVFRNRKMGSLREGQSPRSPHKRSQALRKTSPLGTNKTL